ncbi:hypothetical protein QR680_013753 [Steinernema hermaphroditum]|uniref:SXP/RAL-2 family protein Ani s 5-like cation-binding domain-containing protein n=1 Tax=Steinernema hermaphroditum TaxID=289476 RepID=A0AA39I6J2_9BILA|nr:hypothetical protein QR680_013753 [Steinernema hermaphroditum]
MKVLLFFCVLGMAAAAPSAHFSNITQFVAHMERDEYEGYLKIVKESTSLPYIPNEYFGFLQTLTESDYDDLVFIAKARDAIQNIRPVVFLQAWDLLKRWNPELHQAGEKAFDSFSSRINEEGQNGKISRNVYNTISWLVRTGAGAPVHPNGEESMNLYIHNVLREVKQFNEQEKAEVDTLFPELSKLAERIDELPSNYNFLTTIPVYF